MFNIFEKSKNGLVEAITDSTFEAIRQRLEEITKKSNILGKVNESSESGMTIEEEKSEAITPESQES